jgi:hypothetical protein
MEVVSFCSLRAPNIFRCVASFPSIAIIDRTGEQGKEEYYPRQQMSLQSRESRGGRKGNLAVPTSSSHSVFMTKMNECQSGNKRIVSMQPSGKSEASEFLKVTQKSKHQEYQLEIRFHHTP